MMEKDQVEGFVHYMVDEVVGYREQHVSSGGERHRGGLQLKKKKLRL